MTRVYSSGSCVPMSATVLVYSSQHASVSTFPKFHQLPSCSSCGQNILDQLV